MLQPDHFSETWDPGGKLGDEQVQISSYVQRTISSAYVGAAIINDDVMEDGVPDGSIMANNVSRTELDSHANMPVVGKNCYVLAETGKSADVSPYTPDYDAMKVPIVDAAVRYDCKFTGQSYALVIRNALYVPAMSNNLIPPFILREAGIQVNDTPKIHLDDPTKLDHAITFKETEFQIPLSLWGTFSCFETSKPSVEFLQQCEEIYLLTPTRFNPHCDTYSHNEDNMLDWEGNIVQGNPDRHILLSQIEENQQMIADVSVSHVESKLVDQRFESGAGAINESSPEYQSIPGEADEICRHLSGVSVVYNDGELLKRMNAKAEIGRFMASIGSTSVPNAEYLVDDELISTTNDSDSDNDVLESLDNDQTAEIGCELYNQHLQGQIHLDEFMRKSKGNNR